MGLPLLAGSLLIALGPPAMFLVTTVSRRPYLIIALLFGYDPFSYITRKIAPRNCIHADRRCCALDLEHLDSRVSNTFFICIDAVFPGAPPAEHLHAGAAAPLRLSTDCHDL